MKTLRIVFDTNIFISAIIFGGNPRQCLELARNSEIQLFSSRSLLLELSEKLQKKFFWTQREIHEVIQGIVVFTTLVVPGSTVSVIKKDPSDNKVLECAEESKADYIISGDKKHLLSLRKFKKIPILSATDFLKHYYKSYS